MHLALSSLRQRPQRFAPVSSTRKTLFALVATLLLASLSVGSASAQLSAPVRRQMAEISAFKHSFSPAEQKMSFNLVLLSRAAHGSLPAALARFADRRSLDAKGNITVEVDGYMTAHLLALPSLANADKVNGQVPAHAFRAGRLRAHVHTAQLLQLATDPDVKSINDLESYTTNAGSITSQGYVAEGANKASALGVRGTGVRVGVLSDSASAARVSALIASGDLPADTLVIPGQAGLASGTDEGTAMMEIVHDMAPEAKLLFATSNDGPAQFAANIRTLRYTYGCDVIVDDVTYSNEPVFQDGTIALAVNDVTADGALYFSSAANSGNLTQGQSGTWEGDFLAAVEGSGPTGGAGVLHNFGTADAPIYTDALTAATTLITLQWSDAFGQAADDYDLYVLNAAGTSIVAVSAETQDGTQDPLEGVSGTFAIGQKIIVALYDGSPRALHVDTHRGRLAIGTTGSTSGHNAADSTVSTAAVYWNAARRGPIPFTGGSSNPNEIFSSDGPRKIFFNPDGSAITPGNFLFATGGGTTLQKPDVAAADGVSTATPGFLPFFGTSAAAPHAAAIAALVKSANPALTNTQIRAILTGTALDNMAPGVDRDSGYGIVSAIDAVNAARALLPSGPKQ